jgi:hypothetical protein
MRWLAVFFFFATLCVTPGRADERGEVMSVVKQTVADFNNGNMSALAKDLVDAPQIIDDFPPFFWNGSKAFDDWNHAFEIDAARRSIVGTSMKLLDAKHIDVLGDSAYVVVPAICYFTLRSGHSEEAGQLTLALTRSDQTWRISAFAWSKDKD